MKTPPHFRKKEFSRFFFKKEHPAFPGLLLLYSSEEKRLKKIKRIISIKRDNSIKQIPVWEDLKASG
jgi:hypothetical protein